MAKEKMKGKLFFVFIFAVFLVLTSAIVSAAELADFGDIEVNGAVAEDGFTAVTAGETIDVRLTFSAVKDEQDVRVKAWIEGYREDIEAETSRFDISDGRTYTKTLSLELPVDLEIKEDYKLMVRVASKNNEDQERVQLTIQRPSYELEVLSVEFVRQIEAGEGLQVNVVLKNRGGHEIEDVYIKARIAELGVEKLVYAGDLAPEDCKSNCEDEDATEKSLILNIPKGVESGEYIMEVKAYNDDAAVTVKSTVIIEGAQIEQDVEVVSAQLTKEVKLGGSTIYTLEIINPSDETKTVTITTPLILKAEGIEIKATPQVIIVPAESSQEVQLEVKASETAETGKYTIPVEITSDGREIKQVGITANVIKAGAEPVTGLTRPLFTSAVVLAIILVVLLIVLFTTAKKPSATSEEEKAYY